jgi:hypothetical protein
LKDSKRSIILNEDEVAKAFVYARIAFYHAMYLGIGFGDPGWEENRQICKMFREIRENQLNTFSDSDWHQADGANLIRAVTLGQMAQTEFYRLFERAQSQPVFRDIVAVDKLFQKEDFQKIIYEAIWRFQFICVDGEYCEKEIHRRSEAIGEKLGKHASPLACFMWIVLWDKDFLLEELSHHQNHFAYWHIRHWIELLPDRLRYESEFLAEIQRGIQPLLHKSVVASEREQSEHDNEKRSTIYEAISIEIHKQQADLETSLHQLVDLLNDTDTSKHWRYFPLRIRDRFIDLTRGKKSDMFTQRRDKADWERLESEDDPSAIPEELRLTDRKRNEIQSALGETALKVFELQLDPPKMTAQQIADRLGMNKKTIDRTRTKIKQNRGTIYRILYD